MRDSGSIWPHLPSAFAPERSPANKQQQTLAATMYPRLARAPQPKPPPHPLLPRLRRAGGAELPSK
jgi:hypothetical protein